MRVLISILFAGFMVLQTAFASEMPAPLDRALAAAETQSETQVSFTMIFRWKEMPPVHLRFDAAQNQWSILEGDSGVLPVIARKKLRNLKKEAKPGGILYADFRPYLKEVSLESDENGEFVYRFRPPEAAEASNGTDPDSVIKARLHVDPAQNLLRLYSVRSQKGFKPNPGARLEDFILEHEFARVIDGLPPLQTRMYLKAKGERFFRQVDEEFTVIFSNHALP